MTLSRKGLRRITVDDAAYRWRVRRKPTYAEGLAWTTMRVSIQLDGDAPRSVLSVTLDVNRPDAWISPIAVSVQPGHVRSMIRQARAAGWDPESKSSFETTYSMGE